MTSVLNQRKTVLSPLLLIVGTFFTSAFFSMLIPAANATIVSPARLEIEGDPGETVMGKCSVINDSEAAQTYYSSTENFEAEGETGNPRFVESDDGLADWITVLPDISVESKGRKDIAFTVDIPKDAGVGGHFAALFWGSQPPKEKEAGTVAIGQKVGVLVFLRVRGEVIEKGDITEFRAFHEKKMYDSLPIDMLFRFENAGNDRLKPLGDIEIVNMFGSIRETIPANKKQGSVLPESVRKFYTSWGREDLEELEKRGEEMPETNDSFWIKARKQAANFALGKYTARLKLKYGLQGHEVSRDYSFYVIPWQLLSLAAAALLVFLSLAVLLIKKYNRWIVRRYQK